MPAKSPPQPISCQLEDLLESTAADFIELTGLLEALLPITISAIIIGKPIIKIHAR